MSRDDLFVLRAIPVARQRGMRVPDERAATASDDFDVADLHDRQPPAVQIPGYELGRSALERLIEELDGRQAPRSQATLAVERFLRESA
jgi:DNA-binding LacI/PurR family transcriptional regulator